MCNCGHRSTVAPSQQNRARAIMAAWHGVPLDHPLPAWLPTYPDRFGRIVWMGVTWNGVPKPIRWWARIRLPLTGPIHGCGCARRLRCWWFSHHEARMLRSAWRSIFRRSPDG